MATRKTEQTLAALHAQIAALEEHARSVRNAEVAKVVAQLKKSIELYGLTAEDLGFGGAKAKAGKVMAGAAKKTAPKAGKKGAGKKVKFSDGQGNTWGGMGKRPNWFKAALAAGKTPEQLMSRQDG